MGPPFDAQTFVSKACSMFRNLEEDWIDQFEGAECELIAAAGMLEQLHTRMMQVRQGECGDELDADLFALREARLGALNDGA